MAVYYYLRIEMSTISGAPVRTHTCFLNAIFPFQFKYAHWSKQVVNLNSVNRLYILYKQQYTITATDARAR